MSLSLQGLGAGFASTLTGRLDDERIRAEKLQDEARTIATRTRLRKQAERDKNQKIADETIGMLTMLGYDQNTATSIANKGVSASTFAIEAGQKALTQGVDPNTIFNFSSVSSDINNNDKKIINDTIGEIEQPNLSEIGGLKTTQKDSNNTISGTNINLETYKNLFAKPDKIESSFSARLAVISQKLARNPSGPKADALRAEQKIHLADLKEMKEAEREKKGEVSESYTLGSVSTAVREVRANALDRFGFKLGLNDSIENMETGQEHLSDIANLNAVAQLTTRNSGIQSETMAFAIRGLYDSAKVGLSDYAFEKKSLATQVTMDQFVNAAKANQYKSGEVFKDNRNLYVYTGYVDPYTNMPFMIFPMGQ